MKKHILLIYLFILLDRHNNFSVSHESFRYDRDKKTGAKEIESLIIFLIKEGENRSRKLKYLMSIIARREEKRR